MKTLVATLSIAGLAVASTYSQPSDPVAPAAAPIVFEQPGPVRADAFLDPQMLSGDGYHVNPVAQCDGINVIYTFITARGTEELVGTDWLLTRIAEESAIAQLAGMNRGKEFAKGVADGAGDKVKAAGNTLLHPFRAIGNIPKGASRFFGDVGEGMQGGKSKFEDRTYANVLGESKAKRQLAFQLGVDPYSSNRALQDQLNGVAWAQAGAQLGLNLGLGAVGGVAGSVFAGLKGNEMFQGLLVDSSPSQLRIHNGKSLDSLGVNKEIADEFLHHPWYSPTRESIVIRSLEVLGPKAGAESFLIAACAAADESDAFIYQRMAVLLAHYHQNVAPVGGIRSLGRLVGAMDANGNLVVPVPVDYALWIDRTSARAAQLAQLAESNPQIKGVVVYTSGRFSPELKKQATALGIRVVENVR